MSANDTYRNILGIETSCDETAAAVFSGDYRSDYRSNYRGDNDGANSGDNSNNNSNQNAGKILSSVVSSQVKLHRDYGGVVPEVASRAHLELLLPVVKQALEESNQPPIQLEGIAATSGPGLIGALLVGVSAAKALALAWDIPFIGVNHLEAHLFATFLDEQEVALPLVVLLVSGGHTMLIEMKTQGDYKVLGQTRDDAVGEAFDKTARVLGLGYPGGPEIDKLAEASKDQGIDFPRPMLNDGLDFSFSGLKTAVVNHTKTHPDYLPQAVATGFQNSVVDVLEAKTFEAVKKVGAKAICVAGGVAANTQLRQRLSDTASKMGIACYLASRQMCTDNAAMVAAAGWWQLQNRGPTSLDSSVNPSLKLG